MLPARADTTTIITAVAAAVAANTAFWVARSAASPPKPRSVSPAWEVRSELVAMGAPRQASAEPVVMNPFRRPVA